MMVQADALIKQLVHQGAVKVKKVYTILAIAFFLLVACIAVGTGLLLYPVPAKPVYQETKITSIQPGHLSSILPPAKLPEPTTTSETPDKIKTPARIYGVYSTSWVAGSKRIDSILDFIKQTKINTMVIDVKDDTGIISFPSDVPLAREIGAGSNRIANIKELLTRLRQEKIYTIARIVVFKDPLLAKKRPDFAVLDKTVVYGMTGKE